MVRKERVRKEASKMRGEKTIKRDGPINATTGTPAKKVIGARSVWPGLQKRKVSRRPECVKPQHQGERKKK